MSQRCLASLSSFSVCLLSSLVGCGDSLPSQEPDARDDADAPTEVPDAALPDAPPGFAITVGTNLPPALIAYRDGAAGWRTPAAAGPATFTFEVTGPYTVVVVCRDGATYTTHQLGRSPDDSRDVKVPCLVSPTLNGRLEGSMVQPGQVFVWIADRFSNAANWDYVVQKLPEGVFDLFGIGEGRIAVRRDVVIAGTTVVEPLDVSGGAELVPVTFVVSNAEPGTTDADITVSTSSTKVRIPGLSHDVPRAAPTSFLTNGMEQHVRIVSHDTVGIRTARFPFRVGDSTAVTLINPLGDARIGVTAGEFSASWTTLTALDELRLGVSGFAPSGAGGELRHQVILSKRFIDATHATRVAFETDIPGVDDEWLPSAMWGGLVDVVAFRVENGADHTAEFHDALAGEGEPLRRR